MKRSSVKQKSAIQRALFGYIDHSFNNKYTYKRKGLIEELGGKKVKRSVVAIPNNPSRNRRKLKDVFIRNGATVYLESTAYL